MKRVIIYLEFQEDIPIKNKESVDNVLKTLSEAVNSSKIPLAELFIRGQWTEGSTPMTKKGYMVESDLKWMMNECNKIHSDNTDLEQDQSYPSID